MWVTGDNPRQLYSQKDDNKISNSLTHSSISFIKDVVGFSPHLNQPVGGLDSLVSFKSWPKPRICEYHDETPGPVTS